MFRCEFPHDQSNTVEGVKKESNILDVDSTRQIEARQSNVIAKGNRQASRISWWF